MTRTISTGMAGILEQLELEQPTLVTTADLDRMLGDEGIKTPSRIVAARLREKGWFIPTDQRGVWEFVPAAVAGALSSNDPLLPLKSFLLKSPDTYCGLTFQAAAWAYEFADRIPLRLEVAVESQGAKRRMPDSVAPFVFASVLPYEEIRGVPVLAIESVLVHLTSKPSAVRSWQSVLEWLPEFAYEAQEGKILEELKGRVFTVTSRTGYLLQGLRPDLSEAIHEAYPPQSKTRFGPRSSSIRHDSYWQIADTVLPFDPKSLEKVL